MWVTDWLIDWMICLQYVSNFAATSHSKPLTVFIVYYNAPSRGAPTKPSLPLMSACPATTMPSQPRPLPTVACVDHAQTTPSQPQIRRYLRHRIPCEINSSIDSVNVTYDIAEMDMGKLITTQPKPNHHTSHPSQPN